MPRGWPATLGALGLALTAPLPALAQGTTDYERAVEARLAGDAAGAEQLLRQWLAEHPSDSDAHVQLGYALLAMGRLNAAQAAFDAALVLAPDYADAREGLATISARRQAAETSGRAGFILLEGARSDLGSNSADWRETAVTLVFPVARRDTLELRGAWYDRFGLEDSEMAALWTHRAADDLWLRFGASAVPSADFRPKLGFTAGGDKRIGDSSSPTVIGLDVNWRRFPAQGVWMLTPALTQYLGSDGSYSITARANVLKAQGDAVRIGGTLRGDWLPDPRTRAFAGAAAGPDTDLGIVTQTRALFAGGEVSLGGPLSLTGSLAREWRDGPADRTDFRLGLKLGL